MTTPARPTSWNTSPITASLHVPVNPDAPVELPHATCQPMVGSAEAAVLFAAGHAEAARRCLEDACARQPHDPRAWLMLLDLHRLQVARDAFDATSERYRSACPEGSRPPWESHALRASSETLELTGTLTTEEQLRPVFDYARTHKLVAVDFSGLVRIGFELAPKLCAALRLFALQSKRVILTHVSPLHAELLATIGLHPEVKVLARRSGADTAALPEQAILRAA